MSPPRNFSHLSVNSCLQFSFFMSDDDCTCGETFSECTDGSICRCQWVLMCTNGADTVFFTPLTLIFTPSYPPDVSLVPHKSQLLMCDLARSFIPLFYVTGSPVCVVETLNVFSEKFQKSKSPSLHPPTHPPGGDFDQKCYPTFALTYHPGTYPYIVFNQLLTPVSGTWSLFNML